jgi:hypothetical protein
MVMSLFRAVRMHVDGVAPDIMGARHAVVILGEAVGGRKAVG